VPYRSPTELLFSEAHGLHFHGPLFSFGLQLSGTFDDAFG
jgi:hypothetical protein